MSAYYNEIDPYAAAWLRRLISAGLIADGVVDERSISDVQPNELFEFTQCHFFAGIGVWSHALRSSKWPDTRPVWTGSCPCQPFSGAGTRKGFADERHLWPHWFHLIEECRPSTIFGEQVASQSGLSWFDLVSSDMEGADYAIGGFDMCAAGFGAPHIRQRLWFVAHTDNSRSQGWLSGRTDSERQDQHRHVGCGGTIIGVGNPDNGRSQRCGEVGIGEIVGQSGSQLTGTKSDVGMAHSTSGGRQHEPSEQSTGIQSQKATNEECRTKFSGHGTSVGGMDDTIGNGRDTIRIGSHIGDVGLQLDATIKDGGAEKTNGAWGDVDWLFCKDGKWRPVRPESFPLAHGATARVGRLRAYGNAIVSQVAQGLIESYMEEAHD